MGARNLDAVGLLAKLSVLLVVIAAIAAAIVGPNYISGKPTSQNFGRLKYGCSPAEAERIMGRPERATTDPDNDYDLTYSWQTSNMIYYVKFHQNQLVRKTPVPLHFPG